MNGMPYLFIFSNYSYGGSAMNAYNKKKHNMLWIFGGISYSVISTTLINYGINKKVEQGVFLLKDGNTKFIILITIFMIPVIVSIAGFFNKYLFSIICFLGFSLGLILFLIVSLCSFCGLETLFSVIGMLYIDIFAVILAIIAQIAAETLKQYSKSK